jgi:hypothetical protein
MLTVYCLAFILPLLVVTILAAVGTGTPALGTWARNNIVRTKTAMAVLFTLLGAIMFAMAWTAAIS